MEIRPGKTAPCELVNFSGSVITEGTHNHCLNVKRAICKHEWKPTDNSFINCCSKCGEKYIRNMCKLTKRQKSLLLGELIVDHGEPFIVLCDRNDDRVAKNLSNLGLGYFANNGMHYSWRKRDGFTNNFHPNEKGLKLMKELKNE